MLTYQNGILQFRDNPHSLLEALGLYEGPTYVYDSFSMRKRAKELRSALPSQTEVYYALKANDHQDVVRLFLEEGFGMDVVSKGELEWSLQQGCPPQKIIFSGVGKTTEELLYALKLGIRQINVESVPELERLHTLTEKYQLEAPIGLRVNPDVDAKTHPYIATGLKNNKFGIELNQLNECLSLFAKNSKLRFQGFSVHIGSQLMDLSACSEAYDKLRPLIHDWSQRGYPFKTLDAGGGLGIFYDRDDENLESQLAKEWGSRIGQSWNGLSEALMIEPGRWLVAHSGLLITRVEYIKKTSHHQFAIVDTGMHHLLRPALYQAKHRILPLVEASSRPLEDYQVVGPICESSDVLAPLVRLPHLQVGDLLAIIDCGAYGRVMSSGYNRQRPPKELFLR